MFRNDTYTGGEHYRIRFHNGTHEVRREGVEDEENETVFRGSYDSCMQFLSYLTADNADYDLNI